MTIPDSWLLPEGVEEMLPEAAQNLEQLRRDLVDLYTSWGYELVIPPLIEFLDSLLTGTGNDLDLQTFKLTDQLSGRMMGMRADMTPQVARIDAHRLKREVPTRLCYLGSVLLTRSDGLGGSRSPFQVGAELYGHRGYESDIEVLSLMLETLSIAGIREVYLDLGHVTIFRSLARQVKLLEEQERILFDALQRKALPELREHLITCNLTKNQQQHFLNLAELSGGEEVLTAGLEQLGSINPEIESALQTLSRIATAIRQRLPELPIHFDLTELRGYHYHTGVVFAAYAPGHGQEVARGGRYDGIGQVFGQARPATGFSTDLRTLLALGKVNPQPVKRVYAPPMGDAGLDLYVDKLRAQGLQVVRALPGADLEPENLGCDREVCYQDGKWVVVPVTSL
jgi:ATP phosphoribosyltransferase regulatory subunit